jgi:Asp-tRNA(Asn)/Glu-tRNA(Gln) amidotransferase A subunit family amidase
MPGADPIASVIGPLSSTLTGLKLFMQTILSAKPWLSEPALIPLPWNSSLHISPSQPLKIGVLWHDNVVKPHPPITRALQTLVSKLATVPNISIIDWKPYLHDEAWAIIASLYFSDGGAEDAAVLAESGEPWRPLTSWILRDNPCVKKLSMQKLSYWQEEREAYRKEYAAAWNETAAGRDEETHELLRAMDVILCPVGPGIAPRHNTAKYWAYTSQWNLLDYPAVAFPVCKANRAIDGVEKGYTPLSDVDLENWKLCKW